MVISAVYLGHPGIIRYETIRPALLALIKSHVRKFAMTLLLVNRRPTVLISLSPRDQGTEKLALALNKLLPTGGLEWMGVSSETVLARGAMPYPYPMGLHYQQHPTPGASIGPEPWLRGGGSFGGYFRNQKDGTIYGITCAHLFYNYTKKHILQAGTKIVQPSRYDHSLAKSNQIIRMAIAYKSILKSEPWELKRRDLKMNVLVEEAERWQRLENETLEGTNFGTITNMYEFGPIYDFSLGTAGEPYLIDYILFKVEPGRLGINTINSQRCLDIEPLEKGANVCMFGRTRGAIQGEINGVCTHVSGIPQFPDETFALNTVVAEVNCGDGGCLVAAEKDAVGMIFASRNCPSQRKASLAFVHDLAWLLARINKKWELQLSLL